MPLRLVRANAAHRYRDESNVFKPGSSWQLQATPRDGAGSIVATTVLRDYRHGFKGTFARSVNHLGGKRLFGWFLRRALAAIEKTPTDGGRTA